LNRIGLVVSFLAFGAGVVRAQQQTPLTASEPAATTTSVVQKPAADGTFFVGPQVTTPQLVRVMAAGYPFDVPGKKELKLTVLSTIVDVDGKAKSISVVRSSGEEFDASAINAVGLCRFAPGGLNGKAVPVRIDVEVPFRSTGEQAVPRVIVAERDLAPPPPPDGKKPPSYTPPIPIHTADAEFADPDERHPYPAVALVAVLVNIEGLPEEVRVVRGLGFGTDEKAVAAVKKYRFLPATDKGRVVAARRNVEVKFPM